MAVELRRRMLKLPCALAVGGGARLGRTSKIAGVTGCFG